MIEIGSNFDDGDGDGDAVYVSTLKKNIEFLFRLVLGITKNMLGDIASDMCLTSPSPSPSPLPSPSPSPSPSSPRLKLR